MNVGENNKITKWGNGDRRAQGYADVAVLVDAKTGSERETVTLPDNCTVATVTFRTQSTNLNENYICVWKAVRYLFYFYKSEHEIARSPPVEVTTLLEKAKQMATAQVEATLQAQAEGAKRAAESELGAIKAQRAAAEAAAKLAEAHHHEMNRKRKLEAQLSAENSLVNTTPGERTAFRRIFDLIDLDMNGSISIGELVRHSDELGLGLRRLQIEEMFSEADTDGSDSIDFAEFVRAVKASDKVKMSAAWNRIRDEVRDEIQAHDDDHEARAAGLDTKQDKLAAGRAAAAAWKEDNETKKRAASPAKPSKASKAKPAAAGKAAKKQKK